MPKPTAFWRTIEFHAVEILREGGFMLTEDHDTGDKLIDKEGEYVVPELNITEFAKLLAERLDA